VWARGLGGGLAGWGRREGKVGFGESGRGLGVEIEG